jgi:hypothetical protein
MTRQTRSRLEATLAHQLRLLGHLDGCHAEYRFGAMAAGGPGKGLRARLQEAGLKDWRFDLAWPSIRFAVEVEGGLHVNGRHNRGAGYEEDLRKYHHAMGLGWDVYRCGAALIKSGEAARMIAVLIETKSNSPVARNANG